MREDGDIYNDRNIEIDFNILSEEGKYIYHR